MTNIRTILTNTIFLASLALFIACVSLLFDISHSHQSTSWFQRSGGLIAALGTIISIRKVIGISFRDAVIGEFTFDGGTFQDDYKTEEKEASKNVRAVIVGAILIVSGSLIAGYGDFLAPIV